MRFLPDIRYGTENYPEKVARRLRALNLAIWTAAAIAAFSFAEVVVREFLNPKPGLWKVGVVLALAALIWASIPLLHRFGPLWGVLTATLTMQAYFFSLTWLVGTGSGLQMLYLMAAALIFVGLDVFSLSSSWHSGCAANCRAAGHGAIRYGTAKLSAAVYNFRFLGHGEHGHLDWDRHFCPQRS